MVVFDVIARIFNVISLPADKKSGKIYGLCFSLLGAKKGEG
jgi:hypothetical protein